MAEERELPVIIHTPHTDKPEGTREIVDIIEDEAVTQERIVIDHNTENTIDISTQTDCWIGFTLYPGKIEAADIQVVEKVRGGAEKTEDGDIE